MLSATCSEHSFPPGSQLDWQPLGHCCCCSGHRQSGVSAMYTSKPRPLGLTPHREARPMRGFWVTHLQWGLGICILYSKTLSRWDSCEDNSLFQEGNQEHVILPEHDSSPCWQGRTLGSGWEAVAVTRARANGVGTSSVPGARQGAAGGLEK